jgi:AcrR family transcriptional regulator
MVRAVLSQQAIDDFRRRAVVAARELFAERGLEALSVRAVAGKLGCSPMTPYRYFEDHAHLISAVRTEAFERLAASQRKAIEGVDEPLERIARLRRGYIDFAGENPDDYRLMFDLARPKVPRRELARASEAAFAELRRAVSDAVELGQLEGDPLTLAHLVWAEIHGLVSLSVSDKLIFGRSLAQLQETTLLQKRQPCKPRRKR